MRLFSVIVGVHRLYTEPVVFSEYVHDIAVAGKAMGVRTVMISNGYIQERPLADLCRRTAMQYVYYLWRAQE